MANLGSARPPRLQLNPPLLNSATPWATSLKDLQKLYSCPHTGAVTTRTSLIKGFDHNPEVHQYALYDTVAVPAALPRGTSNASFNSLGYSPHTLAEYLAWIKTAVSTAPAPRPGKAFIVSITGTPREVAECYSMVAAAQLDIAAPLAVELNLSCPNIPDKPPPAYDGPSILEYIEWILEPRQQDLPRVALGIKTPPYTYSTQYSTLVSALIASASRSPDGVCPVSFITSTNTLGSCLMLSSIGSGGGGGGDGGSGQNHQHHAAVLPLSGIGGMAGTPLHPLSLGNVATIRRMLDEHPDMLGHVQVVGVGGVCDSGGYRRMRSVGADAVAVGTGLGVKGIKVFEEIARDVEGAW
ncbi:dihydroorotate oxidase [Gaeumannomyces tritici R3-111a-1]|uniref:Dihydroorotate dehydrogenase (fumarate) n=1 Tax=Gaeumannomyces tritici (strain R3-111a-1) TaxID=644352 RepID=J3NG75_GAET3|nr:dihydroorotate oxidase [Gaeumannomyces tritici R3-111a-1]EJT80265.1 dihydroorotate oxidase [Gaeumannomyces tritici R3-111a-1]